VRVVTDGDVRSQAGETYSEFAVFGEAFWVIAIDTSEQVGADEDGVAPEGDEAVAFVEVETEPNGGTVSRHDTWTKDGNTVTREGTVTKEGAGANGQRCGRRGVAADHGEHHQHERETEQAAQDRHNPGPTQLELPRLASPRTQRFRDSTG